MREDIINNVKTKKIDFSLFLIGVELLYNVVLISAIQKEVNQLYIYIHFLL